MLYKLKPVGREQITGTIIFVSLFILLLTMIGIHLLDVKVTNVEMVDKGLYTVVTDKGTVNIAPEDILRIERTYTKAAFTGAPVELDKIYTTKGFIYLTSLDSFSKIGHQLMNSVDYYGLPTWEVHGTDANTNLKIIQRYNYAMGTPINEIPLVSFLLTLQYLALSIGGLALAVLIFPARWEDREIIQTPITQECDYLSSDEQIGAIAK